MEHELGQPGIPAGSATYTEVPAQMSNIPGLTSLRAAIAGAEDAASSG